MTAKIYDPIQLKGGYSAEDPRLGRIPEKDERSRRFGVAAILPTTDELRSHTWSCKLWLNQTGPRCVGYSRTLDLAAAPRMVGHLGHKDADTIYRIAQTLDQWQGEDYEGTSVLAGCKALKKMNFIGEYRWAFTMQEFLSALAWIGPVVVGTVFYNSMFDPYMPYSIMEVDPRSGEAGGHAYMFRGITITEAGKISLVGKELNRPGKALLRMRNTWYEPGLPMWGKNGEAFMWEDDFEKYLFPDAELSIVTDAFHRATTL